VGIAQAPDDSQNWYCQRCVAKRKKGKVRQ